MPIDPTDVRFFAREGTVACWLAADPTWRRVFSAKNPDGKPSELFYVVRWLAENREFEALASLLDTQVPTPVLERAAKEYCAQQGIKYWKEVREDVLLVLEQVLAVADLARRVRSSDGRIAPRQRIVEEDDP